MALSAFINLKWAILIDKLIKRIMIDANSVIRSTAPQTPSCGQTVLLVKRPHIEISILFYLKGKSD